MKNRERRKELKQEKQRENKRRKESERERNKRIGEMGERQHLRIWK